MSSVLGFLLMLFAVGVAPILVLAVMAAITWVARKEWSAEVAGRKIVLKNRVFSEQVWIDGVRVPVAVSHRTLTSAAVSCRFEGRDGRSHQLMGSIQSAGGVSVTGHLFVDGRFVGGDPVDSAAPDGPAPHLTEPDDARWRAARQLVGGIHTHGGGEAREAAARIEAAIRSALEDLAHLDEVKEAHRTVAEVAGDDAEKRLQGVLTLQEERVRMLLSTLADLHLATLARTGTTGTEEAVGRARDVLGKLSADAEVDRAVKERAEKVRQVQQKARALE
jgi:hypothetical protein